MGGFECETTLSLTNNNKVIARKNAQAGGIRPFASANGRAS